MARFSDLESVPVRPYDVRAYDLKGRFDWDALALNAEVTIHLTLTDPTAHSIEFDSRVARIDDVTVNGAPAPNWTYDAAAATLRVELTALSPEAAASEIAVAVRYVSVAEEPANTPAWFDPAALRAVKPRAGDPVTARTLNTYSEAESARQWMPSNDRPSDRATFAVEMTVESGEAVIANGDLVSDTSVDGLRTMRYETTYTIPTYLMAFASGEFVESKTLVGDLPIGVWSRRGLVIDTQGILTQLTRLIGQFEELVGPYPFDKYYIVFLPEFGGGEEHAGITFQTEYWGAEPALAGDRSMIAHELAHQWFGDMMTVQTWDDLWIKEGMATLLESESGRAYSDGNGSGRLFASQYWIENGEAIVDTSLEPEARYTSGPYGRAAWLLTQMRAKAGDEAFFATLRQLLRDHAYGTITTDQFLATMTPHVGDDFIAKARLALVAKAIPTIDLVRTGDQLKVTLTDSENAMVLPLEIGTVGPTGSRSTTSLAPNATADLEVAAGDRVTLDPRDAHAVPMFVKGEAWDALNGALRADGTFDATSVLALPAHHQEGILYGSDPIGWTPETFGVVYADLASEIAKGGALAQACRSTLAATGANRVAWQAAIASPLASPPLLGLSSWYGDNSLSSCYDAAAPGTFAADIARLKHDPASPLVTGSELHFISTLTLPEVDHLDVWTSVANGGPTMRSRGLAATRLSRRDIEDADLRVRMIATLRMLATTNRTGRFLSAIVSGIGRFDDVGGLPALRSIIVEFRVAMLQRSSVCTAYSLTQAASDPASWDGFVGGLAGVALPSSVRAALVDPALVCTP